MSADIRYNKAGLTDASKKLKTQGVAVEDLLNEIKGVVDGLGDSWEGEAAQAYVEQFYQLKPSFDNMRQLVDDIATQIDQTLKAATDLDASIKKQLGV